MDRKFYIRCYIESRLKDILRCAKAGNEVCAKDYSSMLFGMLSYMYSVGDISDEIYCKVKKLRYTILRKYSIY